MVILIHPLGEKNSSESKSRILSSYKGSRDIGTLRVSWIQDNEKLGFFDIEGVCKKHACAALNYIPSELRWENVGMGVELYSWGKHPRGARRQVRSGHNGYFLRR